MEQSVQLILNIVISEQSTQNAIEVIQETSTRKAITIAFKPHHEEFIQFHFEEFLATLS